MLQLPETTELNARISKQKFYEKMDVSPALKQVFVEQVKSIHWINKIAPTTTNLAPGSEVTEIEIFKIKTTTTMLDEALFKQIDKTMPYHILFLLEHEGKYQAWIGYKEAALSGSNAFKVDTYFHTEWQEKEQINLKLEGINMDTVYENFVRQIAGDRLKTDNGQEDLKESILKDEQR